MQLKSRGVSDNQVGFALPKRGLHSFGLKEAGCIAEIRSHLVQIPGTSALRGCSMEQ